MVPAESSHTSYHERGATAGHLPVLSSEVPGLEAPNELGLGAWFVVSFHDSAWTDLGHEARYIGAVLCLL